MKRLKELRIASNITQAQLSSILKIHEYGYGQYEREYVIMPIKHLITLSKYFNVSIDYLFEFSSIEQYQEVNNDINKITSGERLKEFRKEQKITQEKLAKILNIGKGTIADYERGRYFIATPFLYTICKKYGISADYLLGEINNPKYLT